MAARVEIDLIGPCIIPDGALYGSQTQRAIMNFPITGVCLNHFPVLIESCAMVKKACAIANSEVSPEHLPQDIASAIIAACDKLIRGEYHEHFRVDMIQGGAGTSTNMNANEVIANIALMDNGHKPGSYDIIHPNDHVNLSQSTNDVYPTAARLAILHSLPPLLDAQGLLRDCLSSKAEEFENIMKVGRTQLQDAVPMSLGAEFAAFAENINEDIARTKQLADLLLEVNLGGTAIGTGINTKAGYRKRALKALAEISELPVRSAANLVEASYDMGGFITFSGVLKRIALKLSKICNDLRLLSSGPRSGLGDISLPPMQAGSSIMPGKVNPVIPEAVNQVAFEVIGCDLTIAFAAESGQLQLNAMEPIIVYKLLHSIRILTNAMHILSHKCIKSIRANEEQCRSHVHNSLVLATELSRYVGYEKASSAAKQALRENKSLLEIVKQEKLVSKANIAKIFQNT